MLFDFSEQNTIISQYIVQLRNVELQSDRMRFRRNLKRIGSLLAYEISKTLSYGGVEVETPLGVAEGRLPAQRLVLATILRAGLPMHEGMLEVFDDADNAFVSAYRKHHKSGSFDIKVEYVSCPNLDDAVLILCDPMLATGASVVTALDTLLENGSPASIHVAAAVAAMPGVEHVQRHYSSANLWLAAVDDELTAKSYIVPGLGDAGDLAYGEKSQD